MLVTCIYRDEDMDKYLLIVLIIFFDIQCGNNTKVESNVANSTNKYQPQVEDSTLLQNIKQIKKEKKNLELKIQKVEKEKSELMASIQKSKRETNKLEHKLKVVKARRSELMNDIRKIEAENKKLEKRKSYLEKSKSKK